ncbi:MAG: hypothetical protein EOO86_01325 [Pedobacter sp.]|nr:MAG: hypothetical protein EOO86_01325 [Pedobacter sp.]
MTGITTIGRQKNQFILMLLIEVLQPKNLGFVLNKCSGLNLAVDYAPGKNCKIYPENIAPEILILHGIIPKLADNLKVKGALIWLRKKDRSIAKVMR